MSNDVITLLTVERAKTIMRLTILHQTEHNCRRWIVTHQQSTPDELQICAYSYGIGSRDWPVTLKSDDIEKFHHEDDCPFMVKGWDR